MKLYPYLLAIFALCSCTNKRPEITGREGMILPSFSLQMPDSITWIKSTDIKPGVPSIYFIFSVYCPHCKSQLSKIKDNIETLKGINIYMITRESFHEMSHYYTTNELNKYANIKIGRDSVGTLGEYLKIRSIPYMALYDRQKKLTKAFAGQTGINTMKNILLTTNSTQN